MVKRSSIELIAGIGLGILGIGIYSKFRKRMENKLSKNFSLTEFASKDGAETPPDVLQNLRKLAKNLEVIRANFDNTPIKINSGYRSPAYNTKIGGVRNSMHVKGKAADIVIKGYTPAQIGAEIEKLIDAGQISQGGLGIYPNFVHYDIRGKKARW